MKFSLILLAALSIVSAVPVTEKKSSNPYLVCNIGDYECKNQQIEICHKDVKKCLRNEKNNTKCDKISQLCKEIKHFKGIISEHQSEIEMLEEVTEEEAIEIPNDVTLDDEDNSESEDEHQHHSIKQPKLKSFEPTKRNVKIIGRANYQNGYLWLALTDAGIEYKITGKTTTINVIADTTAYGEENPARIKIYADDALYLDTIITKENTDFTVNFKRSGKHTVRFIKVSEAERGSIRINEIKSDSKIIKPTAQKAKKIEFIGDSITCAYGVDDVVGNPFSTRTEDGTKSFAYKTAQKFHADYSIVAYSGFAILSCFAFTGERFTEAALPQYYDKLGYSFEPNVFGDEVAQLQNTYWDYHEFVPDLVVINLGTNDNSYFTSIDASKVPEEKVAFIEEYEKFLAQIRANYRKTEILCVLGMMGQEVYPEIEQAVKNYTKKTGDKRVHAFKMNVQDEAKNGLACDGHPAAQSHVDATYELVAEIERLYGWKSDPRVNIELNAKN